MLNSDLNLSDGMHPNGRGVAEITKRILPLVEELIERVRARQASKGEPMPRLFTAIEVPEMLRMRLSLLRAPLSGAKWVDPENMHITLRFAGDIDDRAADAFADALARRASIPSWCDCRRRRVRRPRDRACSGPASRQVRSSTTYRANERAARRPGSNRRRVGSSRM